VNEKIIISWADIPMAKAKGFALITGKLINSSICAE